MPYATIARRRLAVSLRAAMSVAALGLAASPAPASEGGDGGSFEMPTLTLPTPAAGAGAASPWTVGTIVFLDPGSSIALQGWATAGTAGGPPPAADTLRERYEWWNRLGAGPGAARTPAAAPPPPETILDALWAAAPRRAPTAAPSTDIDFIRIPWDNWAGWETQLSAGIARSSATLRWDRVVAESRQFEANIARRAAAGGGGLPNLLPPPRSAP
jgi:hypothetical protein